jgi:hypothetical protein
MKLARHQQELVDRNPEIDPRDVPADWSGGADLDEKVEANRLKRLAAEKGKTTAPAPRPSGLSNSDLAALSKGFGKAIRDKLATVLGELVATIRKDEIGPLQKRLSELEARKSLHDAGVWNESQTYEVGAVVTHSGSAWSALSRSQGIVPGEASRGIWRLLVKKGRDGKHAR